MPLRLPDLEQRLDAQRVYAADPIGFEAARPDYPDQILRILETRYGLGNATNVLEIGPGTGRVTRRLIEARALVRAVEPDPLLAAMLRDELSGPRTAIIEASFEDAALPENEFDLVVAASSFHLVDPEVGLPKLGAVLRPGGHAALWWTSYRDPTRPDPLDEVTAKLVEPPEGPPGPPFELDIAGWSHELSLTADLVDVRGEFIPWKVMFDLAQLRAFYGSLLEIRRLDEAEREQMLEEIVEIARREFGESVERSFVTALHTARKP